MNCAIHLYPCKRGCRSCAPVSDITWLAPHTPALLLARGSHVPAPAFVGIKGPAARGLRALYLPLLCVPGSLRLALE